MLTLDRRSIVLALRQLWLCFPSILVLAAGLLWQVIDTSSNREHSVLIIFQSHPLQLYQRNSNILFVRSQGGNRGLGPQMGMC